MRTKTFPLRTSYLTMLLLFILVCSYSCKKENFNVLPPETQTGQNTLGCLIDDELYFGGYLPPLGHQAIGAEYHKISKMLIIDSYGEMNGKTAGALSIEIDNEPRQDSVQKIFHASYLPYPRSSECFMFSVVDEGEICVTKFDTINKIVSGRFQFIGRCSDDMFRSAGTATKQITQGRFDIKLDVYNQ